MFYYRQKNVVWAAVWYSGGCQYACLSVGGCVPKRSQLQSINVSLLFQLAIEILVYVETAKAMLSSKQWTYDLFTVTLTFTFLRVQSPDDKRWSYQMNIISYDSCTGAVKKDNTTHLIQMQLGLIEVWFPICIERKAILNELLQYVFEASNTFFWVCID